MRWTAVVGRLYRSGGPVSNGRYGPSGWPAKSGVLLPVGCGALGSSSWPALCFLAGNGSPRCTCPDGSLACLRESLFSSSMTGSQRLWGRSPGRAQAADIAPSVLVFAFFWFAAIAL